MKIVIKLPDNLLKGMKIENGSLASKIILNAVYEGTPLPKGYGRLVDADAYAKKYDTNINGQIGGEYVFAPTIIEADKTESEEDKE